LGHTINFVFNPFSSTSSAGTPAASGLATAAAASGGFIRREFEAWTSFLIFFSGSMELQPEAVGEPCVANAPSNTGVTKHIRAKGNEKRVKSHAKGAVPEEDKGMKFCVILHGAGRARRFIRQLGNQHVVDFPIAEIYLLYLIIFQLL
jgi:hypothetical protein